TIGQRRGIGVACGEPLYVVHIDPDQARVVVGPREALETHRVVLRDMNWLGDTPLAELAPEGVELFARIRSTRPPRPAVLRNLEGAAWVELLDGEAGIAPGQACVLYDGEGDGARILG